MFATASAFEIRPQSAEQAAALRRIVHQAANGLATLQAANGLQSARTALLEVLRIAQAATAESMPLD